jgi:Zn-dependent M28 family amino/carboxypeptidase
MRLNTLLLLFFIILFSFQAAPINPQEVNDEEKTIVSNLKRTVEYLSFYIGVRDSDYYDKLSAAADFITNKFKELDYDVSFNMYENEGKFYKNIIAEKNHKDDQKVIIIGAHYDTYDNPGADDNASGVAGLLELARTLKEIAPDKNIRFIAFVNEEPPFFKTKLMGSWVYVEHIHKNKEEIKAAIILESIGYYSDEKGSQSYPPVLGFFYPDKGDFIAVIGNWRSKGLVKKIKKIFKKKVSLPVESLIAPKFIEHASFSDHWSFWEHGYTAVMITDTALMRNPNYHRETDTPETLDYEKMKEVVKGVKDIIKEL